MLLRLSRSQRKTDEEPVAECDSLTKQEDALLEERTDKIVAKLNYELDSPWYNQIFIDNTGRVKFQDLFVSKVKPLLNERRRGILHIYTIDEQYGILRNYFVAIKTVLPPVWDRRTQRNGFSFLMSLFPTIFQLCLSVNNDFTIESIMKILRPIRKSGNLYNIFSKSDGRELLKDILGIMIGSIKKTRKVKL